MISVLGNLLGVIVALSIIFGILCAVTGDETKGNTIIINSITSTILYAIILFLFGFDGNENGIIHSAIPMISGLNKYGNVIDFLKENPGEFSLGFVQLVILVLIITYVSNLLDIIGYGIFGKLTSRVVIVLSAIIIYGMVMDSISDNVVIKYFVYCVESLITVGAIAYTPTMLIANIMGIKKGNWLLVYIVNQLPKSKIGKSISAAITTSVTFLCFLATLETQYGTTENILTGSLSIIESMGGLIVMGMGIYILLKSVFKVK